MWDEILVHLRLDEVRNKQVDSDSKVRRADSEVEDLRRQVAKMALVSQALYELMREKTGILDEDLRRKVREIDRRDGVEDGRVSAGPLRCPKCGGSVTAGALSCQVCGATVAPKYPYEA